MWNIASEKKVVIRGVLKWKYACGQNVLESPGLTPLAKLALPLIRKTRDQVSLPYLPKGQNDKT